MVVTLNILVVVGCADLGALWDILGSMQRSNVAHMSLAYLAAGW